MSHTTLFNVATSVAKGAALIYAGRSVASTGGEIVFDGVQTIVKSITGYLYPEIPHSKGDHLHCQCKDCKFRRYYFSLAEKERQGECRACPDDEDVFTVEGRAKLHCDDCLHCKNASLLPHKPSGRYDLVGHVIWEGRVGEPASPTFNVE